MTQIKTETFVVGGIEVHVHSRPSQGDSLKPAVVFFALHGRHGNCRDRATMAILQGMLGEGGTHNRELYVVTFDHRNHGHRLVDAKCNEGWSKKGSAANYRHAIDMYTMQTGTARDVSFLIDFLPAYLFPAGREIVSWGITGVSLGGHSTWIALSQEPRLSIGIPIIGCPDYLSLISNRATMFDISLDDPKYLPDSLLSYIKCNDPASLEYSSTEPELNPFLGKKILVLSGAADTMVPWTASQAFIDGLVVGDKGVKEVIVQEGAKHETTPEMVQNLVKFVQKYALDV